MVSSRLIGCSTLIAVCLALAAGLHAETGYDLWLRYARVTDPVQRASYRRSATAIVVLSQSPTSEVIAAELGRGFRGLLGVDVPRVDRLRSDGAVIVGTPSASPLIAALGWAEALARLGDEGYLIRSTNVGGHAATVIASTGDAGALYGAFHLLRLIQTRQPLAPLEIAERPRLERRLLNHWDNLDGTIERGYAGRSLWWPERVDQRLRDYARANASIGINGAVINSVNANPRSLSEPLLVAAADIARVLRPYRIRVYLAANFAAPKMLGSLQTDDPLDPAVARWWHVKADEIYRRIPDFGGFVVKANSEGQPGPRDYGRTHADGANVLADAVAPHGGIVMWRAFVYDENADPDRVKRAYTEFVPLDGRFHENVFAQVKNGPLDFQPREPFHPLFGAMPGTPLMAELQITQEYLGQANHLVYLAPMWKEFLDADTYARGPGSLVAKVIDGSLEGPAMSPVAGPALRPGEGKRRTGIAGVANTGRDVNWSGHDFAQANWYAFGRLAWDSGLSAGAIADEWIRMTWGHAPDLVATIRSIMLDSREAFVHYTMPLGLHHLIGGDHYAPMPENTDPRRADWSATYYHRADVSGIGYDRTRRGSGAVDQYRSPLRELWNDPATTPDELLLWFHRLPWTYRMKSGRTLWDELVLSYNRGAEEAKGLETHWRTLHGRVDEGRYQAVLAKLRRQTEDAAAWRDECLRYFQAFSQGSARAAVSRQQDVHSYAGRGFSRAGRHR
jgi:alpha-glucuronidase